MTVKAARIELICQVWVTTWCNNVKQIFIFFLCSDSSISPFVCFACGYLGQESEQLELSTGDFNRLSNKSIGICDNTVVELVLKTRLLFFPVLNLNQTEIVMHGNGHSLWTVLIPTVMFGLHTDVHVALVCCLLAGHSAGGNEGCWGHRWKALSTMTCSSAVTWWDKSSMFSCRLCDSLDKTLTRGTGWSLLNLTSSWALPSPVTCDKQQPAGNRLSSSATQTSCRSPSFSSFEPSRHLWCAGWPQFNHLSSLRSRSFNLTLMAPDKCPLGFLCYVLAVL